MGTPDNYRITGAMLGAGAKAMDQCRREPNHTPQTVCRAVFAAMLGAADIHPGANLAKSFQWSAHDDHKALSSKRVSHAATIDQFDDTGVRTIYDKDGAAYRQHISSFNHLRAEWKAREKSKITRS